MRIKWLIKVTRATVFHKMSSVRSLSKAPGRKSQLHLSVRYGGNSLLSLSLFELVSYECVISQPWTVPSAAALTLAPGQPPYPGQLWAGGLTVEALPNPPPPLPQCPAPTRSQTPRASITTISSLPEPPRAATCSPGTHSAKERTFSDAVIGGKKAPHAATVIWQLFSQ